MYYQRNLLGRPMAAPAGPFVPRVNLADYLANLERFRVEANARGIPIVFLTRPHRLPAVKQAQLGGWRGSVTRYNAATLDWARAGACRSSTSSGFWSSIPIRCSWTSAT